MREPGFPSILGNKMQDQSAYMGINPDLTGYRDLSGTFRFTHAAILIFSCCAASFVLGYFNLYIIMSPG